MRSIGFYSFRGGVGRSNLLLNVAYHLARTGRHVGILDLDLEAPGLTVAPPLLPAPGARAPDVGLIDFLAAATAALDQAPSAAEGGVPRPEQLFYQTRLALDHGGSVHLAPSHTSPTEPDRHLRAGQIHASLLHEPQRGQGPLGPHLFRYLHGAISRTRLEVLREGQPSVKKPLDFLLVDLRTGLTELSDTSVGALLTELVIVSGLNTQHFDGLFTALHALASQAGQPPRFAVTATLVFSPVPGAELDRVRSRLAEIHGQLEELAREQGWLEPDAPFRLLLPSSPGGLLQIHYCDYLAVGDEVLLEHYPETLAAREILEIARRYTAGPEELAQQTRAAIQELGLLGKEETQRSSGDWSWVLGYWSQPPSWRWPLDAFAVDERAASELAGAIGGKAGAPPELETFLNWLAASLSLKNEEKARLLSRGSRVPAKQFLRVLETFSEEQERYRALDESQLPEMGKLVAASLLDWVSLLEGRGAQLVPNVERIRRIAAGEVMPGNVPPWALLAAYLGRSKKDQKLIPAAVDALLTMVEAPVGLVVEVLASLEEKSLRKLRRLIIRWLAGQRMQSQSAALFFHLGNLNRQLARYEDAESSLRRAIELDPDSAASWTLLGHLLHEHLGRHEESEEAYHRAIELSSELADPWRLLGHLHEHLGRYEEAENAFRRAIELEPEAPMPWLSLGMLCAPLGRFEEA